MADNKVKFLRGSSNEYESSIKDNDTFYYTTDTEKLYLGDKEITGGGVTIDDTLSDTSKNPVQNKVINAALNSKADQTAVDSALAQKANSADVTASLAGKSDTGHTHDDRYYTESETNTLLGDKVGVSDFNSHTNNTTVHVTAEEKAAWNGKAELSDIPTTLPANGGNSDTVDGKHANDFAQMRGDIADCNNAIAFGTYNITPETKNAPTENYYHLVVEPAANGAWIKQTAVLSDATSTSINSYTRININGEWSEWTSSCVNADTLDGKHASDFSQIINLGATSTDTKTAIGIQYKTTTYWCQAWTDYPAGLNDGQGMIIAINYKGSGTTGTDNIWCRQIFISPHPNTKIYQRILSNANVEEWTNIADGGNALTATYTSYANYAGTLANTASNICLRSLSSGTAEVTTSNCPSGAWYGKYE